MSSQWIFEAHPWWNLVWKKRKYQGTKHFCMFYLLYWTNLELDFIWLLLHLQERVQFGLKTLIKERIVIWLILPVSYCLGTGGFQVNDVMLLSSKHTFSFTAEKLFPNLKRIDVFTHLSVFSRKTWRRSNLRLCWEQKPWFYSPNCEDSWGQHPAQPSATGHCRKQSDYCLTS